MSETLSHYSENQPQKEQENSRSLPSIEIYPSPTIAQRTIHALEGTPVKINVTSSSNHSIETTLDIAEELLSHGFETVPHIGAYEIKDKNHLDTITERLADHKIPEIYIVRGEGKQKGEYKTSAQVLKDIASNGLPLRRIGVSGYPEGFPNMNDEQLLRGLESRNKLAENLNAQLYVVNQICFDAEKLVEYARMIQRTLNVPVVVGLPIPEEPHKLYESVQNLVGVGNSKDLLLQSGSFDPIDLIGELTNSYHSNLFSGFHVYTFNNVRRTENWLATNFSTEAGKE